MHSRSASSSGVASSASTIARTLPSAVADDPAVGTRLDGLEREDGRGGILPAMRLQELREQVGRQERRVAGEDEHLVDGALERVAGASDRVSRTERALLNSDLDVAERVACRRRGDDEGPCRFERPGGLEHPVDHPAAEDRMEMLGHGRAHARAEAAGHHDCCELRLGHGRERDGWGARIRTWDRGTKTRCLTTWLRPRALIRV